jgi:DMSO reductase family type II enzyme chaperone
VMEHGIAGVRSMSVKDLRLEWLERAQARANVYALLAICLYEPSLRLAQDLLAGSLVAAFRESLQVLPEARVFEEKMAAMDEFGEEHRSKNGRDFRSLLRTEYTHLFIGPGHLPCPPYESVYRVDVPAQERGLVMGRATVDVVQRYQQAGLNIASSHKDLPDHVGTELEFMYYLCQKEAEAWEKGNAGQAQEWLEMQQGFLKEHLGKWIPAFCEAVEKEANVRIYGDLAALVRDHVALEIDRVDSLVDDLQQTTT